MADQNPLAAHVGKTYRIKGATGSAADRRFKITAFNPKRDFGKQGSKPAFEVERLDAPGFHTPIAEQFLQEHEEAKD